MTDKDIKNTIIDVGNLIIQKSELIAKEINNNRVSNVNISITLNSELAPELDLTMSYAIR